MISKTSLSQLFNQNFGDSPGQHSFAPGRINLLGEHIDYLGGQVLPAAIDRGISFVGHLSETDVLEVRAHDMGESLQWGPDILNSRPEKGWKLYIWAVLKELEKLGRPWKGAKCLFSGDLPQGAGLSSSAALEVACANFFFKAQNLKISNEELALLGRRAENIHVGTACGIMDQFISVHGKEDHFLQLNCDTLKYEVHPARLEGATWVLHNSMVSHELGDQYNQIRKSLEEAEKIIAGGPLLEVAPELLEEKKSQLNESQYRKARYVIGEHQRTRAFIQAMGALDVSKVGELLVKTHEGLSRDLGVSTLELDALIDISGQSRGWLGGRMMGGGFGGCTLNLVKTDELDEYLKRVHQGFSERFSLETESLPVVIGEGARVERWIENK